MPRIVAANGHSCTRSKTSDGQHDLAHRRSDEPGGRVMVNDTHAIHGEYAVAGAQAPVPRGEPAGEHVRHENLVRRPRCER